MAKGLKINSSGKERREVVILLGRGRVLFGSEFLHVSTYNKSYLLTFLRPVYSLPYQDRRNSKELYPFIGTID